MRKLRAGIIGLGVGEAHIQGYESHPSCEVVALCDFSDEKLANAKQKYPTLRVTKNADEILTASDIDIVSIASFDNYHHEQALKGLRAGKHLFIEKPICLHESEFREITEEFRKNPKLRISSNLILRRSPRFINLRDKIRAGQFGALFSIEAAYNYGRLHKILHSWRGDLPDYSVTLGGAIHLIDLVLWLTGDKVVEVTAYGNAICSRGSKFKNNDMVMAIARFESGLVGKFSANFGCVFPHFHELVIYGSEGTFMNGLKEARLYKSRDPQVEPELIRDAYPGAHKGDLLNDFVEAILTGREPAVSWSEISSTMAICFAIDRSVRESRPVKVERFE